MTKSLFQYFIPIDKAFILDKCPNLSETTIERVLNNYLMKIKISKFLVEDI